MAYSPTAAAGRPRCAALVRPVFLSAGSAEIRLGLTAQSKCTRTFFLVLAGCGRSRRVVEVGRVRQKPPRLNTPFVTAIFSAAASRACQTPDPIIRFSRTASSPVIPA